MLPKLVAVLVLPAVCQCFFFGSGPEWDGLKAKWGFLGGFKSLPRTRSAALTDGWVNKAPGVACDGNPNFRGERYWKNGNLAVILVFDPAGYIAGIQAGFVNTDNPNGFPSSSLTGHPFVLEDNVYYITVYFVDPVAVCNGRTAADFDKDGTGVGLWIQNGTDPLRQSIRAPQTETAADSSNWTKGKCFYTMGLHYWFNVTENMSCDNFYPVFLMYNGGKLDSFGWAFGMNIEDPTWFEHPPQRAYTRFLNPVPDCLYNRGTMTTLHVYMKNSPRLSFC